MVLVKSICLFVRTSINSVRETIQIRLEKYSWNFMLEDFLKMRPENSVVIKIRQYLRIVYVKTAVHLWWILAEFLLEWRTYQTEFLAIIFLLFIYNLHPVGYRVLNKWFG